jgi:hypothetical protein
MERAYEDFTLVQRSLHFHPRDVYYITNEEMVRFPQFTDLVRRYEQSKEVEAAAAAQHQQPALVTPTRLRVKLHAAVPDVSLSLWTE